MRLIAVTFVLLSIASCGSTAARPIQEHADVLAAAAERDDNALLTDALLIRDARRQRSTPAPVASPNATESPTPIAVPARAAAAPAGWTCPTTVFCYARLRIAGAIVPYTDCTGHTDVGTQIRSLECVSTNYLAGHGYTAFGRITGWRAGDIVYAHGTRYIVYDAFTQDGCRKPARALAPLSLQTSLTPTMCGPIIVVQARPD